jgi:hypothetical protein
MNTQNERSLLRQQLDEAIHNNRYPTVTITEGAVCYRVQNTCNQKGVAYREGFHFWSPTIYLGRYNDPNGRLAVCYVATKPTSALAEVFGRRHQRVLKKPELFHIGSSDLHHFSMATNTVTKTLKLLDIGGLLSKLGMTTDKIATVDYKITQEIIRFFSDLNDCPIDGIAYRSRHHDDGSYCYALWQAEVNGSTVLNTESIVKLANFVSNTDFPSWWSYDAIDAEEMLTDILGYEVV